MGEKHVVRQQKMAHDLGVRRKEKKSDWPLGGGGPGHGHFGKKTKVGLRPTNPLKNACIKWKQNQNNISSGVEEKRKQKWMLACYALYTTALVALS
jgi:hypothetical protein